MNALAPHLTSFPPALVSEKCGPIISRGSSARPSAASTRWVCCVRPAHSAVKRNFDVALLARAHIGEYESPPPREIEQADAPIDRAAAARHVGVFGVVAALRLSAQLDQATGVVIIG